MMSNSSYEQRTANHMVEAVREQADAYVELLQDLVRFPSVINTTQVPVQERVARALEAVGASVDMWTPDVTELRRLKWFAPLAEQYDGPDAFAERPMVVGRWGTPTGRSLLLSGHVDVVPAGALDEWRVDPWGGEVRGRRLYGRGAMDCKAGVAASIAAIDCLRRLGTEPTGEVIVESTIDQEIGGVGAIAARVRGVRADAAITTEPTGGAIALASVGVFWARVSIDGSIAHAARSWEGRNALNMAARVHEAVRQWGERREREIRHPLYDEYPVHATFNPGTFHAGGYPSSVPDHAMLEYRVGLVPGETIPEVLREFEAVISEAACQDDWMHDHPPKVELFGWYGEPTEIDRHDPLVVTLAGAFEDVKHRPPTYTGFTAACDMGKLQHLGDMPVVNLGCQGDGWHQVNEYAHLDDYLELIAIYAIAIRRWLEAA